MEEIQTIILTYRHKVHWDKLLNYHYSLLCYITSCEGKHKMANILKVYIYQELLCIMWGLN